MSLLNPGNPAELFIQCGRRFLASPGPVTGIEFDDAVIALKRHAHLQLHDEELAAALLPFSRLIREQAVERVAPLFAEVVELLAR